jgi:hypothetical protein
VNIFQFARCLLGKHEHGRRITRDEKGVVRSRCLGCGRRMIRVEEGRHRIWQLEKRDASKSG